MRKYILFALCFIGTTGLYAQDKHFKLSGKINGLNQGLIWLIYPGADGKQVQDSALVNNKSFEFKGQVNEPVMAYIALDKKFTSMKNPNLGTMFLSAGSSSAELAKDHFKDLVLRGSKTQDEYKSLESQRAAIEKGKAKIMQNYIKANDAYITAVKENRPDGEKDGLKNIAEGIKEQIGPLSKQAEELDLNFIGENPDSYYSAYLLSTKITSLALSESQVLYQSFSPEIQNTSNGKLIDKELKAIQAGSPGNMAANFTRSDINGKKLSLSDYKGEKYILLDFWASWCVPCRKGNPHLLSLYNTYKDKGLEIIGISDDDNAVHAWKNAVEKDQIGGWKHILRGLKRIPTGFDRSEDIDVDYGIHALPTKILIDKNGMIVGRYGGNGDPELELDKKLALLLQ